MTTGNPERILVVALRRLGDVLFVTPLIRSLKRAYPGAAIDALVFAGTEGILAGNPDLACVITMPPRPRAGETLALLRRLWRRYDLALSTQAGDRPTLFAWAAGRRRAGFVDPDKLAVHVKRRALDVSVPVDPARHRVPEVLRLAQALGIAPLAELVAPSETRAAHVSREAARSHALSGRRYAVIHVAPKFRYKQWTEQGWRGLAAALATRGLAVVATGGPDADEQRYLDAVWAARPEVERLDGALSWPALAEVLRAATVYIGPDTAVTHLAAATGAPTVALYGPTDPRLWGPWPLGGADPLWAAAGTIQTRGNVWLVQNPLPCLPCQQEGCLRRLDSHSQCLDELQVGQVLQAVDAALAQPARRRGGAPA
jgi:heptosyltransferase-3